MSRRAVFIVAGWLLGIVATAALAEGAARIYVYAIAEEGRLFRPDDRLGWAVIPDLDLKRKNRDGEYWHIRTNAGGFRSAAETFRPDSSRRILVLGDSFAFGQGVELDDRFDSRIARAHPDWSFVNRGVMGWGTDQELIAARDVLAELHDGDVILLVTFFNDFLDVVRHSHSGRMKPWFELEAGALQEHPPEIGLAARLRDRSYLLSFFLRRLTPTETSMPEARLRYAGHLYRHLVLQETGAARSRGVEVLIAHHGGSFGSDPDKRALAATAAEALGRTCQEPGVRCVSLNEALQRSGRTGLHQVDGHWNAAGNEVVGEALRRALEEAPGFGSESAEQTPSPQ